MTIHDSSWLFMIINYYLWLFMIIRHYSWLIMISHDYSWLGPGPGLAGVAPNDQSLPSRVQFFHQSGPYESYGGVRTTIRRRISIRVFLDRSQVWLKQLLHQKSRKSRKSWFPGNPENPDFLGNRDFDMNGVAVRAMEVSGPPFCTEFRAGSNGTSPGPQTPDFFFVFFLGVGVGGSILFFHHRYI